MGTRPNLLKSVNTMKSFSKSSWLPSLSQETSDVVHKKIEDLLKDSTTTSSSDLHNTEIDYPIPYTFRVVDTGSNTNHARCPPFYMQLDHTIAVLWHVFANNDKTQKKNIGIGQLQWALYFLKGIKDPLEGTRRADIDVAIKSIEDALIDCYAEMANLVMKKENKTTTDDYDVSSTSSSVPKIVTKIGTSSSMGMMVKPKRSAYHIEDFNISSLSYTTLEFNPDISTTLEELIRFRNTNQAEKITLIPSVNETDTSAKTDNTKIQVNDAYEMLKKLREDQIKKLNVEIENLKEMEEAASIRTYFKIILQYIKSYQLWKIVSKIVFVIFRLLFDQFRMDNIFSD